MLKNISRVLLFLVTLSIGVTWSLAGDLNDDLKLLDSDKGGDKVAKPAGKPGATATTTKDPVELVFSGALKKNLKKFGYKSLDDLRQDQKADYDKMKKELTPKLKEAMDKVKEAAEADKSKAAKEVSSMRTDVTGKIVAILSKPDPNAKKPKAVRGRNGQVYYVPQ